MAVKINGFNDEPRLNAKMNFKACDFQMPGGTWQNLGHTQVLRR